MNSLSDLEISEYIDQGILLIDCEMKILTWNKWLERHSRVLRKDAIGRNLYSVFPEIEGRAASRQLESAVQNRMSLVLSASLHQYLLPLKSSNLQRRSGIDHMRQLVQGCVIVNDDVDGGILLFITDVTEKYLADELIRKNVSELKQKNDELDRFAYIASHDMQEPLRMVISYLQLIERRCKDKLDSDALEFIAFAVDGASRMRALINALLDYSRTGQTKISSSPVPCTEILDIALANLSVGIREKKARITTDPLPEILCDKLQLSRVFQNLIANAIKFHGEASPHIHISSVTQAGEHVLSIQDNGIGIADDYHDSVFEIFRRIHTYDEYRGTGIGLSLCRKIIDSHGGRIWVESKPDLGSTFYFTIPESAQPAG